MPSKARIISERNTSFDHYIQDVIDRGAWEREQEYYGITEVERADFVRRKLRQAGRHMDPIVSVRAFWTECNGCQLGGPDCRYHVKFTVFDFDKAREFMAQKMEYGRGKK